MVFLFSHTSIGCNSGSRPHCPCNILRVSLKAANILFGSVRKPFIKGILSVLCNLSPCTSTNMKGITILVTELLWGIFLESLPVFLPAWWLSLVVPESKFSDLLSFSKSHFFICLLFYLHLLSSSAPTGVDVTSVALCSYLVSIHFGWTD